MESTLINQITVLSSRPHGHIDSNNLSRIEKKIDAAPKDRIIVENIYLSLDPTHRIWMSDREQYLPPLEIGEPIRSFGIGRVVHSPFKEFQPGELVSGLLGWQKYSTHRAEEIMKLPPLAGVPPTAYLSVLGLTGLTAYFGYFDIMEPTQPGTMVISGAAGAVGSIVGQIAKMNGHRVIGIAGKPEKISWLKDDLGFDEALNYSDPDFKRKLQETCSEGIQYYFDNTGGEISDAILPLMSIGGKVTLCGLISTYNDENEEAICRSYSMLLMKRLTVRGFIVTDHYAKAPEAVQKLHAWVQSGKIKYKEHIIRGLENAPQAVNMLFDGSNQGKLILQVADF